MRITKYEHACLLIEEARTVLIDPGNFTRESGLLDITTLPKLDAILYTHEHQDHFDLALLKDLQGKFPEVVIISNPAFVSQLKSENIQATSSVPTWLTEEKGST